MFILSFFIILDRLEGMLVFCYCYCYMFFNYYNIILLEEIITVISNIFLYNYINIYIHIIIYDL
jgi:hypothetical protein